MHSLSQKPVSTEERLEYFWLWLGLLCETCHSVRLVDSLKALCLIGCDHDADRFLMSSHANRVEIMLLLLAPVEFMAHVQIGLEGFSFH